MNCNQHECPNPAAWQFTWPGRDEAGICAEHLPRLQGIAVAMGLHLQIQPVVSVVEDAAYLAGRLAGLAEAAKACDDRQAKWEHADCDEESTEAQACGDEIRALKSTSKEILKAIHALRERAKGEGKA